MEGPEVLDLLRLLVGLAFLSYASTKDWQIRKVKNLVWIVLGLLGLLILEGDMLMRGLRLEHQLILIPVSVLFFDVFWERKAIFEKGRFRFSAIPIALYFLGLCVVFYQITFFVHSGGKQLEEFLQLLTIPVMILVAYALYLVGLLKGGADAKALMSIAVLVPCYPQFFGLPLLRFSESISTKMAILFPFALVVLLNASILMIFLPLTFFIFNLRRKEASLPECFFGYRVPIDDFPKFVWLMDRIENGEHVRVLFPRKSGSLQEQISELRNKGFERVWVTPQIPFLIPMTVSFVLSFLFGNLLFAFFSFLV